MAGIHTYAINIKFPGHRNSRLKNLHQTCPVLYTLCTLYVVSLSVSFSLHYFIDMNAYMCWILICGFMCFCEYILNHLYLYTCVWVFPLVLIVCALFVCWMPNQVRRVMTAAVPKDEWSKSYLISYIKLHPVADTFFYLSSVLNPLLYNLSSRQFRTAFLQMLCCRLSIQHVNKQTVEDSKALRASGHSLRPLLWKKSRHRNAQPSSRDAETLTPSAESSPVVQIIDTSPPVSLETETWVMSSLLIR